MLIHLPFRPVRVDKMEHNNGIANLSQGLDKHSQAFVNRMNVLSLNWRACRRYHKGYHEDVYASQADCEKSVAGFLLIPSVARIKGCTLGPYERKASE